MSQANISTSTLLSLICGEYSDFVVGRILLYFSHEISMTISDSLFDLVVAGLLHISGVKLFSIVKG